MRLFLKICRYLHHVIAVAYICLYLLSPFFHHHSDANLHIEETGLHSHVLGEIANHARGAESPQSVADDIRHDFSAGLDVAVISVPPRFTGPPTDAVLTLTHVDVGLHDAFNAKAHVDDNRLKAHRGREFILSASNVSPPLV